MPDPYFTFNLLPQQTAVFNALKAFTSNQQERIFILRGYAGTGKTSLMSGYIKYLRDQKITFHLLASTGRAAKILADKTSAITSTVHSHIYTFKDLDDDLETVSLSQQSMEVDDKGQLSLVFDLKPINSSSTLVYIVDEASMIGDVEQIGGSFARYGTGKLLSDLIEYDKRGKFIFVGDACQLPPIGQDISPALSREYFQGTHNRAAIQYELTEIVRQDADNGIVTASLALRRLQVSNPVVKFASFPLKGYKDILLHNSHIDLVNNYIHKIRSQGFEYATLICQTNRHCSDLNRIIRSAFGRQNHSVSEGDILQVTQNNYLCDLVNGDMVEVLQTAQREYRCGLSFLQVAVLELASKNEYRLLMVEDILYAQATNLNAKQHKDLMIDFFQRMKHLGIRQKDEEFKRRMLTDPYLNALKAVFGYAITCHKSQGGEWEEVFLYLDNKIHGIPKPGIYQWLYTAITRARRKLHAVQDWFIK